jgi:hypothetical protein
MQFADSACNLLYRVFDYLLQHAQKAISDPFASCRKLFDNRMQYYSIFADFLNFACGI